MHRVGGRKSFYLSVGHAQGKVGIRIKMPLGLHQHLPLHIKALQRVYHRAKPRHFGLYAVLILAVNQIGILACYVALHRFDKIFAFFKRRREQSLGFVSRYKQTFFVEIGLRVVVGFDTHIGGFHGREGLKDVFVHLRIIVFVKEFRAFGKCLCFALPIFGGEVVFGRRLGQAVVGVGNG